MGHHGTEKLKSVTGPGENGLFRVLWSTLNLKLAAWRSSRQHNFLAWKKDWEIQVSVF